jgi:hypothetical protein
MSAVGRPRINGRLDRCRHSSQDPRSAQSRRADPRCAAHEAQDQRDLREDGDLPVPTGYLHNLPDNSGSRP